jgi:HEAT repeat protein
MSASRLHILGMLLLSLCSPRVPAAQQLPPTPEAAETDVVDTQLRVNKTTLLENKSDKNRIDAATLLLFSDNPAAREILLDVLKRNDNPGAKAAVCEALNPTRAWQKPLRNKEDFIKPLIGVLTSEQDFTIAKLAAEATLIFGYSQVQQELEKAATDPSLPISAKKNVIYALRRHPDKQAVARLIVLLDSPEPEVVEAARGALGYVGIAVSSDPGVRKQMLTELQQRGTETFLRERLVRQETRMRELETDLDKWQTRYRAMLDRLYNSLTDDAAKNAFLTEQLGAQETVVKRWALDKLDELRKGTSKPKLSEPLQAVLLSLISDPSREVRSKTARLLALMAELNAAKPLLEQMRVEPDDSVRRELFVALGGACYYASLPTSGRKVTDDVRKETLEWAVRFLADADPDRARSGADVIGKLLEQDGLKPEEVDRYLKVLSDRYLQAGGGTDQTLRSYLLGTMAGLCAARSTCRVPAGKLYKPLFEQGVGDSADGARQAAFDGLANIDKADVLRRFRKDMSADSNPAIRMKPIEWAGEVGGAPDLDWLAEKLGGTAEGEAAWQAMLKIFRGSRLPVSVLTDWMARVGAPALAGRVSAEQKVAFFTLVEQRALTESNTNLVKEVQNSLADLYIAEKNFKQGAECLKTLLNTAGSDKERQRLRLRLLGVYLASASIDQTCELVANWLADKDLNLSPDGPVVKLIEEHLEGSVNADPSALLEALAQIPASNPEVAQTWRGLVSRWAEKYAKAKRMEENERVSN